MRDAFINEIYNAACKDRNILFLSNDYGAPALDRFREELPDQFLNMAIAEQNMISVAAGLAHAGKKVYIYGIAPFVTLRCFEQIKIDLCTKQLPVTIIGVGTGYSYSMDGPTHQAMEDISVMRALPKVLIYSPADNTWAGKIARETLDLDQLSYVRLDRESPIIPRNQQLPTIKAGLNILEQGNDLCLIATGIMVKRALEVAQLLKQTGINATVIDAFRLKPFPWELMARIFLSFNLVVSIEEHTLDGGLGSIIAEWAADLDAKSKIKRLGVTDFQLSGYGNRDTLQWERGLDQRRITDLVTWWHNESISTDILSPKSHLNRLTPETSV